jgi:NAD(P)-dependent dehydrogenase (short-subunit alcohol dehydrogenase family)
MKTSGDRSRVWFITGCSSGFGRALAAAVLARGYRCVVTARDPATVRDLAAGHAQTSLVLPLDVTDRKQREHAVTEAQRVFGGIDVLVNNAGYAYYAAAEEGDEARIREMFDTNFFGLVAMTQRVLPGMRERRRGHVVNISSVGGLVANVASAFYAATKFAVEAFSESMAQEVGPHGIRVTIIEPGPFRTDFQGRSVKVVPQPLGAYAETVGARRAALQASDGKQPGDPARAADAIVKVVESDDPPLRLLLGKIAFDRAGEKFESLLRSREAWREVTLGTDFPSRS